jgi:hypothetical protein
VGISLEVAEGDADLYARYPVPPKQFPLNRLLVDRKDQPNGYNFEELVNIYFHTCRCYKVARKKLTLKFFLFANCAESFQTDSTLSANKKVTV